MVSDIAIYTIDSRVGIVWNYFPCYSVVNKAGNQTIIGIVLAVKGSSAFLFRDCGLELLVPGSKLERDSNNIDAFIASRV